MCIRERTKRISDKSMLCRKRRKQGEMKNGALSFQMKDYKLSVEATTTTTMTNREWYCVRCADVMS